MVAVHRLCQRALWPDSGRLKACGAVDGIATAYLRAELGNGDARERVWGDTDAAPGNDTVRLHRIALHPEGGNPGDVITMQTPVRIEMEHWNLLPGAHLHAALHVCDDRGIIAFTSGTDLQPSVHIAPPVELFRSACKIPGNLLNRGFPSVSLLLVRDSHGVTYRLDEAIGFEVIGNKERSFAWYGKEPGVLCPALSWSTEYLGNGTKENV